MALDKLSNIMLGVFLFSPVAMGGDMRDSIKVENLYIETEKRVSYNTDYHMVNQDQAKYDLNLGLDLTLPATMYYNSKVVSTTDSDQFRFVGLNFEVGARPFTGIDVYFGHFSGHALDDSFNRDFPQTNKIGIRFNLIKGD